MATVLIDRVTKRFGRVRAVDGVTLEVRDGEFMVLLGPSGCGKTTALRCIAGLERMDAGRIVIGGADVTDRQPGRRGIAMVFQSYAVFPHMTVRDNITFGLRIRKTLAEETRRRTLQAAELLQIGELLDRYPAQLSGGQRQRVAVARAIVMQPEVLLMDEPLSNLDALLRLQMRAELKRLHRETRATTVYVTHDQVEALSLGDRIAVMRHGKIVQCDTPSAIYNRPASTFVGGFIGSPPMNFFRGTMEEGARSVRVAGTVVALEERWAGAAGIGAGVEVLVGVRPEAFEVTTESRAGAFPAVVVVVEPLGGTTLLTVSVDGETAKVTVAPDSDHDPGQRLWLRPLPDRLRLMEPGAGRAVIPAQEGARP